MAANFQNLSSLTVRIFMRPVTQWTQAGEPFTPGYSEPVVRIEGLNGRAWELTMDGDRVTSLASFDSRGITTDTLTHTPLETLKSVAKAHLRQLDTAYSASSTLTHALDDASAPPGYARNSLPTVAEFAEAWKSTPARVLDDATGETLTRRQALHKRWDTEVTIYAIDKWTREARNRGLIPPAKGNKRGRKTAEQGGQEK